ncbi:MAG: DUF4296 domain-containing protein [Marinoscillum sp.]
MRKPFFVILIILFLFGCSKHKVETPDGVLSHDEMVRVLIDVHILEAKVKKLYLPRDSSQVVYHHYEKMLFKDLGIDRTEYIKSMEFYVDEIEELKTIYDEIVDSLLSRQKTNYIN